MRKYIDEGYVVTELAFTDSEGDVHGASAPPTRYLSLVCDNFNYYIPPKDINKMIALLQEAKKEFYPDVQQTKTL